MNGYSVVFVGQDVLMHRSLDRQRTICGQVIPTTAQVYPASKPRSSWCPSCWKAT